jgi:two-component system, cell cycle sensor histidine kinase and response regulator CckA
MSQHNGSPESAGDAPFQHLQERWEKERELTIEFFRLVNASDNTHSLIDAAVNFFQRQSHCQAVAVRLRRGKDFPYYRALGFPEEFLFRESSLCSRDCYGEIITDNTGSVTLECRCGDVIYGRFDSAQRFFTPHGSFWTNSASEERQATSPLIYRGNCSSQGYRSIAIIALKAGKERIGLLQLNDKRDARFTLENILFWERLANHLAVALARFGVEETLRESEQRLAQAVNVARLGIIEHDHRTGVTHDSRAFRAIYGLDTETQATRQMVMARILPEDREPLLAALRQSLQPDSDGLLQCEHRILHPEGVRWLLVRAQTFFQGEAAGSHPIRTVGAVMDITAQKQAEFELSAGRRQLRTALDAANLGVWSHDLETGIGTADPLTRSIFGWTEGELITGESLLSRILPEDRETFLEHRALEQKSAASLSSEYRIHLPDGSVRWLAAWGNLVRDVGGSPTHLAGVVQNITGRKQAEQHLKTLEERSRHAQKMEAIGRLAGGIAHDFNNLLMVIRSYTEILEDCLPPADAMRRNTQAILKAADRASSLTGQMLAFSRKQMLNPIALGLNDAVAESAKMLQRLIGEDIELRVKPAPDLWTVRADPDMIAQVLVNLSVNSRDAMPGGGILTLQTRNVTVGRDLIETYPFLSPGEYAVLSVTDTGTGISKDVQERMFDPFFTTKSVGKGTGLGLSTVYGIVKQSGGYLLVESEPGEGACFSVYLPRIHKDLSNAGIHDDLPGARLANAEGTKTLLLVEDEDAIRESLRLFLAGLGYNVLAAGSGQQALAISNQCKQRIHLMITDVVMPWMSGCELSQTLATIRPEMKTLFMSGFIEDAILRHGVQTEGVAFLQKPFSLDMLARRLRELLA